MEAINESTKSMTSGMEETVAAASSTGLPSKPSTHVSIEGRRILMLAQDGETGDRAQEALEAAGVTVQRLDPEARPRLEDQEGQPTLPRGEVVIVDGGSFEAMRIAEAHRAARTVEALVTVYDRSMGGSLADMVLVVSYEDALLDANRVTNMMLDRMTEASIARSFGGYENIPAHIRRHMNWLPGAATVHSRIGLNLREDANLVENGDFTMGTGGWHHEDELDRLRSRTMDELFGDDVLERERRMRSTYVLRDEPCIADVVIKGHLPENDRAFDFRAHNEAFNMRQGRAGRGTPGKRRGGRKGR